MSPEKQKPQNEALPEEADIAIEATVRIFIVRGKKMIDTGCGVRDLGYKDSNLSGFEDWEDSI